ncbi:hypothetical protein JTB14_003490 [Gonioctena quinquepunctata]|nr:hypothetical protein JTB14_003490 [Gonioctena quinquepunctata]
MISDFKNRWNDNELCVNQVDFDDKVVHPVIHVPNQLVGAPLGTDVTLECNVEAYPKSINYWVRDTGMYVCLFSLHTKLIRTELVVEICGIHVLTLEYYAEVFVDNGGYLPVTLCLK